MSWLKRPNIFKKKEDSNDDEGGDANPEEVKVDEDAIEKVQEDDDDDEAAITSNNNNNGLQNATPPPGARSGTAGSVRSRIQPALMEDEVEHDPNQPAAALPVTMTSAPEEGDEDEDEDEDTDEDDDDDDDVAAPPLEGMYDPSEFENLNVGADIKELFTYIMRYTPQTIDLETRFKPFIPEYIPAVGDIDAFIKVRRRKNNFLFRLYI